MDLFIDSFGDCLDKMVLNLSPSSAFRNYQQQLITNDGSNVPKIELSARGRFWVAKESWIDTLRAVVKGARDSVSKELYGCQEDLENTDLLMTLSNVWTPFARFFSDDPFDKPSSLIIPVVKPRVRKEPLGRIKNFDPFPI